MMERQLDLDHPIFDAIPHYWRQYAAGLGARLFDEDLNAYLDSLRRENDRPMPFPNVPDNRETGQSDEEPEAHDEADWTKRDEYYRLEFPRPARLRLLGASEVWREPHLDYSPTSGPCPACRDRELEDSEWCLVCSRSRAYPCPQAMNRLAPDPDPSDSYPFGLVDTRERDEWARADLVQQMYYACLIGQNPLKHVAILKKYRMRGEICSSNLIERPGPKARGDAGIADEETVQAEMFLTGVVAASGGEPDEPKTSVPRQRQPGQDDDSEDDEPDSGVDVAAGRWQAPAILGRAAPLEHLNPRNRQRSHRENLRAVVLAAAGLAPGNSAREIASVLVKKNGRGVGKSTVADWIKDHREAPGSVRSRLGRVALAAAGVGVCRPDEEIAAAVGISVDEVRQYLAERCRPVRQVSFVSSVTIANPNAEAYYHAPAFEERAASAVRGLRNLGFGPRSRTPIGHHLARREAARGGRVHSHKNATRVMASV
jgi:hypothetical protein